MKGVLEFDWCVWIFCFSQVINCTPTGQGFDLNLYHITKSSKTTPVDISSACEYNDKVYRSGENFTTDNPCETCECKPPGYTCTTKTCDVKPGCKAIQKANKCCPEYVCECERNGKMYGNGEKVEEPNPCKVCYCKGGEVKCAPITCYSRPDCRPVYVEGRCCPKYDHCPPLEMKKNSTSFEPTPVVILDIGSIDTNNSLSENEKELSNKTESNVEVPLEETDTVTREEVQETTSFSLDSSTKPEEELNYSTVQGDESSNTTDAPGNFTDVVVEVDYGEDLQPDLKSEPSDITKEIVLLKDNSTDLGNVEEEKSLLQMEEGSSQVPETTVEPLSTTTLEYTTQPQNWTLEQRTELQNLTFEEITEPQNTTIEEREPQNPIEPPEEKNEETEEVQMDWVRTDVNDTVRKSNSSLEEGETRGEESKGEEPGIPGLKMLSAEQMEFLHVGEEPPIYVNPPASVPEEEMRSGGDVVVVPQTTPITVEMTKVAEDKNETETVTRS